MTEDHETLLPEILSLYALNSGNTYRYSVSSAGAGGMIQMIPQTYQAIRSQYAIANLEADFVDGMRDHENASEAMLLYMMDTWSNLAGRTEVQEALSQGIATKPELLAAGYNSNPRRLPGYLKTGGAGWKNLIPDETQMYLRIYSAVDQRISWNSSPAVETHSATGTEALGFISILSWIPKSLVLPSFSLFH
jgi:hypothetical protein